MWKSQEERSGLYGGCCSVSQPNLWSLSLTRLAVWEGVIMQKNDSVRQHSRSFWLYGASQHPQPPRNKPHLSDLLNLPPFPMLDEHTLHYAHLQSNKQTTVWSFVFSLCISPTLEMAVSIRNSVANFCEEYVLWRVFGFHFGYFKIILAKIIFMLIFEWFNVWMLLKKFCPIKFFLKIQKLNYDFLQKTGRPGNLRLNSLLVLKHDFFDNSFKTYARSRHENVTLH